MAKIISQTSFADYGMIEILGELERFLLALPGINDEALMLRLEARRGKGRNDYPVRVMWNLIIAMKVFGHRTVESFRRKQVSFKGEINSILKSNVDTGVW